MKPIPNFDKVQAAGNIENLPAGGYVCEIRKCIEVENKNNNGTHLEIAFDVCEGDYRGFFEKDYRSQDREDKYWHGMINQNVPDVSSTKYDQQCKFFKRFTNALQDSNNNYHWDWNEAGLKGKRIGVLFGERERMSQRGNVYTVTEAREIIAVDEVREGRYKMPLKKALETGSTSVVDSVGFAPVSDEDDDLSF